MDLSNLSLAEAQEAIDIQLQIRADKKRRGVLGGLRARFRAKKKAQAASSSPLSGSGHLTVGGGGERRSSSPSPGPPSPNVDIDAMSYEELLALSEAIGDVKSKGLSETEIERLPTSVFHKAGADDADPPSAAPLTADGDGAKDKKRGGWLFGRRKEKGKEADAGKGGKEEQKVADSSPTSLTSAGGGGAADAAVWKDTCSICLEPFRNGDLLKYLPCFHHMHCEELDQWLTVNASCPVCKEKPILH